MKHPDNLADHLVQEHDIKPWSVLSEQSAVEEHHRLLHEIPRKPVNHIHEGIVMADNPYPTPEQWRQRFSALPQHVRQAIYDQALTACPDCGIRGVPASYAVVVYETLMETPHGNNSSEVAFLTEDEREALAMTGRLANLCRRIVGDGPTTEHDWNELAMRIHGVQHMIMAQAAARAYPGEFRLLGHYRDVGNSGSTDE